MSPLFNTLLAVSVAVLPINAQTFTCVGAPAPSSSIITASGFAFAALVGNLTTPRGITIDSKGNLLVVQAGLGVSAHTVDANGCITSSKTIISNSNLTHGIDVYNTKLYASTSDIVYAWDYNPDTLAANNMQALVTGMDNSGSKTRSILISRKNPNYLIVSVGSSETIDFPSNFPDTERASIKSFDLTTIPTNGVSYVSGGKLVARGVRNVVGLAEDKSGSIHGADNAMDNGYRLTNGVQTSIKDDNPAENIFNLGDPQSPTGLNGGYPYCFVVWEPKSFVDKTFQPGDWFVQAPNSTFNDSSCSSIAKKPEAILTAHTAPLDIKFGVGSDSNLYVGMHGRWHSDLHEGYKVVSIAGTYSPSGNWNPTASLASQRASVDVIANADATKCQPGCFHPVGLAWSADGQNLFVTSDSSGEIYLVKKN